MLYSWHCGRLDSLADEIIHYHILTGLPFMGLAAVPWSGTTTVPVLLLGWTVWQEMVHSQVSNI